MRISDWSSDVCSSDLTLPKPEGEAQTPAIDHLLVIYATIVAPELLQPQIPDGFPENCLLLSGVALRQYFGAVLSDRMFVALSSIPVNVNVASAPALCSVPQLGENSVAAIIAERNENGPFSSWADRKSVV